MRTQYEPKTPVLFFLLIFIFSLIGPGFAAANEALSNRIRQLAEQGDGEAQFSMGLRYDLGDGVERNPELAAQWFEKAATAEITGACLYLGMKYEFGAGVKQDKAAAIKWYEQAAVRGWPQAAFLLGNLYLTRSVPDPVQGCAWLAVAAVQKYPGAEQTAAMHCVELDKALAAEMTALREQLRQRMKTVKQ